MGLLSTPRNRERPLAGKLHSQKRPELAEAASGWWEEGRAGRRVREESGVDQLLIRCSITVPSAQQGPGVGVTEAQTGFPPP